MHVLIFNCGSSSQSFRVYATSGDGSSEVVASGKARNVATRTRADAAIDWVIGGVEGTERAPLPSHRLAARAIVSILEAHAVPIDAVGHRFVHGGALFDRAAEIDDGTIAELRDCERLAPIHNPNSLSVIEICHELLPSVPQYVVFDTSFHCGMPEVASSYALPLDLATEHGFRKYGFHGLSYRYVSAKTAELLARPLDELRLIICHLGTGGSSVAALKDGHTLDTSTGYSPLSGLVMSTRSGDLDPTIVLELVRACGSPDEVAAILNEQSGLVGLSGFSSNLLEIVDEAEAGDERCRLAYDVYVHRLRSYIGAYFWLLGGADAIVFTDSVGVASWQLRARVCAAVESLGVVIDELANREAPPDGASRVSGPTSKTEIWVVPTDEESVMLAEVVALASAGRDGSPAT